MSKINIPQPEWPEITVFVKGVPHCLVPIVDEDGVATYDKGKAGKAADALIAQVMAAGALRKKQRGEADK